MRTSGGDRRRSRIFIICAALIIFAAFFNPASALDADYFVAENGSVFHAEIGIQDTGDYNFIKPGYLGEKIPATVSNVSLVSETGANAEFKEQGNSISFEKGNYTVSYDQILENKNFRVIMENPYNITLYLPTVFRVENPLLGMVSSGGSVDKGGEYSRIFWEKRKYAEARFYDDFQEKILLAFGSFWIVLVLIFMVPYLLSRQKKN